MYIRGEIEERRNDKHDEQEKICKFINLEISVYFITGIFPTQIIRDYNISSIDL